MALPFQQPYGQGTASIGGLVINNPLRLENTAAPVVNSAAKAAPAAQPQAPAGSGYSAPDPYAAWGGAAGFSQAVNDYGAAKNAALGSISDRITNEGVGYQGSILDFLDSLTGAQGKVNNDAIQNELARRQGTSGVLSMVGRGIRSGGTMLANKNATTSSASDALARAWGDIGRREMSGVGSQYAQGQNNVNQEQQGVDLQRAQGVRHLGEDKTQIINGIVSDAQNAISSLNQLAANASLPDRMDIEAEKQAVRTQALSSLQQFDAVLSGGLGNINPSDMNANRTKAAELDTAGTASANPFTFTSSIPQQFQGTGPFPAQLPVFPVPNSKRDSTPLPIGA